ncbi:MAG: hypothetical protein J7501_07215 [Bdellovibrio sp.]|nr:hypothetical protein [Bdellovibrio sp.]
MAAPLGTIPTIEEQSMRLLLSLRSDLWSSPYTYKESPVRIFGGEFRVPIYTAKTWAISANIYDESLNLGRAEFQLGKESVFIGNSLRSQSAGIGARKDFGNGSSLTVFAASATASDDPWGNASDIWFEGTVNYRWQKTGAYQWFLALNQSNNRGFYNGKLFPYAGVSYESTDFEAAFGFPFVHITWGNLDTWKNEFLLTPFGVSLTTFKNLRENFQFRATTGYTVRSYLHESRSDDDDRLYYQELLAEAALKKYVSATTGVVFALGGSGDRRLYESEHIYVPNNKMQTINSDFYARLGLEFIL